MAELSFPGVYGTKGVAASENLPGEREFSVSWTDASGNLMLFGGYGDTATSPGRLNDLWQWDGTNWTWMSGSDSTHQSGTYGTKGVPEPGNVPGARWRSVSWTDASGGLWLFGGEGKAASSFGYLNDLWKWDGSNWVWVSGSNEPNQPGVYGTKGVPGPGNVPGARCNPVSWKDAGGNLWLFGGSASQYFNDLWKWDGSNWTWVSGSEVGNQAGTYGTKGVAAPGNVPGARAQAQSWTDAGGNLWLFGGYGRAATSSGYLNDLWKWDGTNWTWVGGSAEAGQAGTYGTKGIAAPENVPGARSRAVSWTDASGNFWLFGGLCPLGQGAGYLNDLWKWDGTNWTWVSGSNEMNQNGIYGSKGVAAPGNVPGARSSAVSWVDAGGFFWLFGGASRDTSVFGSEGQGLLHDLWRWDGTNWTWVSGPMRLFEAGAYGIKGVASPKNLPGARSASVSWTDAVGTFWLFGGYGFSATGDGFLNDLWRWDGTNWTWVSGSSECSQAGSYGTKGVPAPANVPGARKMPVSWTDASGNLWLFGGQGMDTPSVDSPSFNDLWKWDGTNWAWISGADAPNQTGTYGTKGVAAPGNVPGARFGSVSWTDASGDFWLFGGAGFAANSQGRLNDLWKWDGTNWTWVSGSDRAGQYGTYGTKGVAAPGNVPGARYGSVSWKDASGGLWLFGGQGNSADIQGRLNDLWRWDGTNWTWVSGSSSIPYASYGIKGVAAPGNVPGGRQGSVAWTDLSGNFWLFGGETDATAVSQRNELWKWDGTTWTWVSGSNSDGQDGIYGTKGAAAPGNAPGGRSSSVSWADPVGNLWTFGGYGRAAGGVSGTLNDLWVFGTTCSTVETPTAGNEGPFGTGGTIRLTAQTIVGATYLWTGPNGFASTQQNPTIPHATMEMAGSYSVTIIVGGCRSEPGTTVVVVAPGRNLSVFGSGAGSGRVVSIPLGIDFPLTSVFPFASDSRVTLTATPSPGSRFAGWTGGGCFGTDPCAVLMDGARSVDAMFQPEGGAGFHPLTPCRVVDTRNATGPLGGPALSAGELRDFGVRNECGVPFDAAAVALNVTVTNPTSAGSLTIYPGTWLVPETETIFFAAGRTRANNITMSLQYGLLSVLDRQATGTVDLIIDVSGYYR
ncbi:MAG: hypothetical protein IPN83_06430 [Holophagales bacterium]|nr:hypothetical protein [Holophagales bacterium]